MVLRVGQNFGVNGLWEHHVEVFHTSEMGFQSARNWSQMTFLTWSAFWSRLIETKLQKQMDAKSVELCKFRLTLDLGNRWMHKWLNFTRSKFKFISHGHWSIYILEAVAFEVMEFLMFIL